MSWAVREKVGRRRVPQKIKEIGLVLILLYCLFGL